MRLALLECLDALAKVFERPSRSDLADKVEEITGAIFSRVAVVCATRAKAGAFTMI